jgi:DNA-binding Lrp family transcriptional regulator
MPTAYILLNTEIGAENQVLKALKKIEGVEEAHNLWGVYDIIANIRAENMEKLKYIITKRIEKIGRINSKLTMIITEKPQTEMHEQVFFEQNPIIQ